MKKFLRFAFILTVLAAGFALSSCGGDDSDDDELGNNGDTSNETVEDTALFDIDQDNLIVGNWIERSTIGSYSLFCFKADGTYKKEVRGSSYHWSREGTYTVNGTTLTMVETGKSTGSDSKIYSLDETDFHFTSYVCKRTTLTSLEDDAQPSYKETALAVNELSTDLGYGGVIICPSWGVSYVLYSIDKDFNESSATKYTNGFNDALRKECKYSPGTTHKLTAVAYDKNGHAFRKYERTFTMPGEEMTNFYFYKGKQYPLYSAEMSAKHDHSGTNTGSNFKYLKFISDSENRVQFEYAVHEWEGIDKEWTEGTYKIGNSSNYYTYGCIVVRSGNSHRENSGTLKIEKATSTYMAFDFTLEETRGHFEGTVQ